MEGTQINLDVKAMAFSEDGRGERMPLRFREHIGKLTLGDVECEISMCVSRAWIYFMTKDRQVCIGLKDIGEAVFRHWGLDPAQATDARAAEETAHEGN